MLFMNEYEIEDAFTRWSQHPTLGLAALYLKLFVYEVNHNSDGWPYWSPPVKAAEKLMELLEGARRHYGHGLRSSPSIQQVREAIAPIEAFIRCERTKRRLSNGTRGASLEFPRVPGLTEGGESRCSAS